jgi:hypothetical protein
MTICFHRVVSTEIHVPSSKVEQAIGHSARLECKIKANPLINHYWMRNGQIIENSLVSSLEGSQKESKYEINIYNQNTNEYLTVSVLHIKVGSNVIKILYSDLKFN